MLYAKFDFMRMAILRASLVLTTRSLQVVSAATERPVHEKAAMELPATYKRLVGRHVGQSFRDVFEEETVDISLPGEGEVRLPMFGPTGSATAGRSWPRLLTRAVCRCS